jgi:YVTN family beta-propeller protein
MTGVGTFSATVEGQLSTGAEPWNVVCTPDGRRVFVANSRQDTITVIDTSTRTILGQVDLRNSLANDPDRSRHFQPRGLAVTADSSKLYVTRFLSFTKTGGRQADDLGKEGLVAVFNIDTGSTNMSGYAPVRTIALAPQITGFKFPGLTNFRRRTRWHSPNQLQSVVIRGIGLCAERRRRRPARCGFNLDTHAFVNVVGGVTAVAADFRGAEPAPGRVTGGGQTSSFFANPWAIVPPIRAGAVLRMWRRRPAICWWK